MSSSERFAKISKEKLNYLIGKITGVLGNTDISNVGDGTVTGAIDSLNSAYGTIPVNPATTPTENGAIWIE